MMGNVLDEASKRYAVPAVPANECQRALQRALLEVRAQEARLDTGIDLQPLRDHLEKTLQRQWYRDCNQDTEEPTTGAARRRREARVRGEASRGQTRGVALVAGAAETPSWSQRKKARRRENQRQRQLA